MLRKPLFLGDDTGVDVAFRRLQETGQTMAVVVDAHQRAVGVITMDDLLQGVFTTLRRVLTAFHLIKNAT